MEVIAVLGKIKLYYELRKTTHIKYKRIICF